MSTLTETPAGTEQARAGLNFTRDGRGMVLVDGRHLADVWEAVPGTWSTTGIAGYVSGFGSQEEAEDAVIAAYHQLPVRADYEVDVFDAEEWRTVVVGRVGVDVDRLTVLGEKAKAIAAEYQTLRKMPVRVTLWSVAAPTSRVTTYAEYHWEGAMSEQHGQPGQPGQLDPLTVDPLTAAADAVGSRVNVDWSTLGQADRVWRVNPVNGQPQGLTIAEVSEGTVSGQLDDGPTVTLPLTDIAGAGDPPGQILVLEDELTKLLAVAGDRPAPGKSDWMRRMLTAVASDPETIVWVHDAKAGGQTRAWMTPRTPENEAAARRAIADPEQMVVGQHLDGSLATWPPPVLNWRPPDPVGQAGHGPGCKCPLCQLIADRRSPCSCCGKPSADGLCGPCAIGRHDGH